MRGESLVMTQFFSSVICYVFTVSVYRPVVTRSTVYVLIVSVCFVQVSSTVIHFV